MRSLVALGASFAVLFAGAWAGTARGAAGPATRVDRDLARATAAAVIPVGDSLEVAGQPMQLSVFYTPDPPDRVALFYARAFAARGVLPVASSSAGFAHVSAFDRRDGLQRFVTAVPQPSRETLVMVGISNPRSPPRFTRGAESASFPVPPDHRAFLAYRSSDASGGAESAQFVSSSSPAEVLSFYRRELGARGWSQRPAEGGASLAVFARGAEVLSVAVQALEAAGGAAVFVNRTDGGSR